MSQELINKKVIFFDCYQTLIDVDINKESQETRTREGWKTFVILLSKNYGINTSVSELVSFVDRRKEDFYIGKDKITQHHNFATILSEVLEKDLKHELSSQVILNLIYEYRKVSRGYLSLHYPKIIAVLTTLAEKYILSIASYTQSSFTRLELEELDIAKYFSYFVFSSDIGLRKESVEFYKKCLDIVGAKSDDCVMIGDNYNEDVLTPSQLGMHTIWLQNPGAESPSVNDATAIVSSREFGGLPAVVDEIWQSD